MYPSAETLFVFARSLQGEQLKTLSRGKPFRVSVNAQTLDFTPGSPGQARSESKEHVAKLLSRLSETGSFQQVRYKDITFSSSYVLALVSYWQEAQKHA